jgi:hypothetical protein
MSKVSLNADTSHGKYFQKFIIYRPICHLLGNLKYVSKKYQHFWKMYQGRYILPPLSSFYPNSPRHMKLSNIITDINEIYDHPRELYYTHNTVTVHILNMVHSSHSCNIQIRQICFNGSAQSEVQKILFLIWLRFK